MARAVSPWTWRRALRDHGPDSPSVLLTLYVIGTYMDRDGIAWPSQENIAAGARASVRTVQRHIAAGLRGGWLGVQLAGRCGQGWRHNAYRAAVPDALVLDDQDEHIAEHIVSQVGDVESRERADTIVSPPSRERNDTMVSPPSPPATVKRDDIGDTKVTTSRAEGDDTGRQNVATQLCRTNSRSETPALRTPALEEEAHDAQSRAMRTPLAESERETPESDKKVLQGIGERIRKARKHLAVDPGADVVRLYGLDAADIQKLRATA